MIFRNDNETSHIQISNHSRNIILLYLNGIYLEFAYLKELAILDMHLRHFILKTSVDLEHTIIPTLGIGGYFHYE